MEQAQRVEIRHIPALDGLRGMAVAGVLVFHGGELSGGFMGVDLFFVLSGFLITTLLLREYGDRSTVSLKRFWFRRARRLLPALFGLLAGVALYAWLVADSFELGGIRGDGLAATFYVANWQQIFVGNGYWDVYSAPSPFLHTWSLAIEEQFYLIWPLVVLGVLSAARGSKRVLLAIAVVGALVSASVMALLFSAGDDPSRAYLGTDTRVGGVLVGASLAIIVSIRGHARTERSRLVLEVAGSLAAVGLAVVWVTVDGGSAFLYRFGFLACGIAAATLIAAVAHPRSGLLATVFSLAPLRWLGLISYGLYLWHWPIFLALRRTWRLDGWALLAVGVPISLAVSVISYRYLEQPIRHRGLAAWGRPALLPIAGMACVLLLLVATVGGTDRGPIAIEVADPAAASEQFDSLPDFSSEADPGPGTTVSPITVPAGPEASTEPITRVPDRADRVLVVGDSVGGELAKTLTAQQERLGLIVVDRALYACPLGSDSWRIRGENGVVDDRPACAQYAALWTEAAQTFRPDAVIMMFGGAPLGDREVDGVFLDHCDPGYRDWYVGEVQAAVDLLGTTGATVFVAPAAPPSSPFFDQDDMDRRTACMTAAYEEALASRPAARLLRIDEWTCPDGECRLEVDGVELRPDGIHYEGPGAILAADWVAEHVFAPAVTSP